MKNNFTKTDLIKKCLKEHGQLICAMCGPGIIYSQKELVEDHIDNDRKNNSEGNKQLLCRRHNYEKNPPMLFKLKGESFNSVRERGWVRLKRKAKFAEMEKNMVSKPLFVKWFYQQMLELNKMLLTDVIDSGSFISGVGPDTIHKRYLKPLCSRVAYCEIIGIEKDDETVMYVKWRSGGRERFIKSKYAAEITKYSK